nr:immunoglobulin light chain junction region [Macaca mulatta]
RSSYADSNVFF